MGAFLPNDNGMLAARNDVRWERGLALLTMELLSSKQVGLLHAQIVGRYKYWHRMRQSQFCVSVVCAPTRRARLRQKETWSPRIATVVYRLDKV